MDQQIIYARTNAEFLNKVFGTNYSQWMRGRWYKDYDTMVWMIRLDGVERQGWINKRINDTIIVEKFIGRQAPSYTGERERKYRIVVNVIGDGSNRKYHILGTYRFRFDLSTPKEHVLEKI